MEITLRTTRLVLVGSILIIAVALIAVAPYRSEAQMNPILVAPGFEANVFADQSLVAEFNLAGSGPSALAFDSRGRLFVATLGQKILILVDNNDDGVVDQVKTFASNIPIPLGLEFRGNGELYATSNVFGGAGRILRLRDTDGDDRADEIIPVLDGLPSEGQHQTGRLKFGPDGLLYIGQGSSTDAGEPDPGHVSERPFNAKILRLDLSSFSVEAFASGLRNPFGLGFHPETGALFATDAGSGELCQLPPCQTSDPVFDELNWVVQDASYGFPHCEGAPVAGNTACAGVRAPLVLFPPHTTPTSIAFYTGPQAGADKNQLLITIYKRLFGQGGDLKRFVLTGSPQTGFQATQVTPPIVDLQVIDPFDGPLDTAIDPISGDIYLARFDPVNHRDQAEHHHIIYRIHRSGSDGQPFIGPIQPATIQAGSAGATITLVGRHLKPGSVVTADGTALVTRPKTNIFELEADLSPGIISSARTLQIAVRNPNGASSNVQQLVVFEEVKSPVLNSLDVTKKGRVVPGARVGMPAKKMRLIANGRDFDPGAQLLVDGSALELESSTATQLVGRFTAAMVASPGELTVQVRNSTGRISSSLKLPVTE